MLLSRSLLACVAIMALTACPPPAGTDAGNDVAADVPPVDVVDVPPPPPPVLTGPCMSNTDCPDGDTCMLNTDGWPGGYCTHDCARDIDCDTFVGYIAAVCRVAPGGTTRTCLRQCLNGFDCNRPGYTCVKPNDTATSGICVPSCTTTSCGTGARCNEWTGLCQAESIPYPPTGGDDGAQCTRSGTGSECRSLQCNPQVSTSGQQTGWIGGYCLSDCALSAGWTSTDLWPWDQPFPQSNCPSGAICFPSTSDMAENGPGVCLHGCEQDSDCRASEGYFCKRTFALGRIRPDHTTYSVSHTWPNGICEPIDCLNDTTHHCPTGFTCMTRTDTNGNMTGRCVAM